MMEAMQMGSAIMGPSIAGGDVHSFNSSLGKGAFDRMAKSDINTALKAQAADLATTVNEFIDQKIGIYKLKVQKVRYLDKVTDQFKDELTLVSPDFNNEAIGEWTDEGKYQTGTAGEYRRIVDRANNLAQTDGDVSMFWVSPSDEKNSAETPHRAYLWVKHGDEVTAYAYSLTGKRNSISKMMNSLGFNNEEGKIAIEDQTIIKKGQDGFTHKDIYQAFAKSLNGEDKVRYKGFLDRFKKDIEIPDRVREEKMKQYKEKYETQLKERYKDDIKEALESFAQGFTAISRLDSNFFKETEKTPQILTLDKHSRKFHQSDRNDLAYYDYFNKQQKDRIEEVNTSISPFLQPIIPGIIGFMEAIISLDKEIESSDLVLTVQDRVTITDTNNFSGNDLVKAPITINKEYQVGIGRFDDEYKLGDRILAIKDNSPDLDEQIFWQEVISLILKPVGVGDEDHQILFDRQSLPTQRILSEALVEFIPQIYADKMQEFPTKQNSEGLSALTINFQQGLEVIAELISTNLDIEFGKESLDKFQGKPKDSEELKQRIIETDIVKLGKALVEELMIDKDILGSLKARIPETKIDSLAQLSFLLHAYEDTNSPVLMKQLIATLIFKQIQKIQLDKDLFVQNPRLEEIFNKFGELSAYSDFLDTRFDLLLLALQKTNLINILSRNKLETKGGDISGKLIFIICQMAQLTNLEEIVTSKKQSQFSIEKLQIMGNLSRHTMIFNQFRNRKKNKNTTNKFSPYGLIYQYQYHIAYKAIFMPE